MMKIGCQTYTWEMLGEQWSGTPDDILDAAAGADYQGVEFAVPMIGDYYDQPEAFSAALAARGLEFAAFAYASEHGFTDRAHWDEETAQAERALGFAAHFPRPMLCLGGAASPSRDDYEAKFAHACRFYSEVAHMGADMGVTVCAHPHSHHGSLLESAEEYARLLGETADSDLAFNPDTGHIVRGGQDLLTCIRIHLDRIRHVHVKDVTAGGKWAPMGEGVCDFPGLFGVLQGREYDGWIVAEEESELAREDPAKAIGLNRDHIRSMGW